jgi:alkaline phosphatase
MNRRVFICALVACVAIVASPFARAASPRNVILFIGDGMGLPQRMVAEKFSLHEGKGPLAMNTMPNHSTMTTHSASSLVTDSAAAATAIACGEKTNNGTLGMDAEGRRVESCAEAAKKAGKRVGIVTTVPINHATPAGFYAHRPHRSHYYDIACDLAESGFDVFMGGALTGDTDGARGDAYALARANGYTTVEGRAGFDSLTSGACGEKVWWRYRDPVLPYAIDVEEGDDTPRLPEITKRVIELLGDNFFVMIEGGRIDYAGHENDAAANLRDTLELDEAVKVALEFQKSHPDTLVIVTGDHETGGMSLGSSATGYAFYVERLGLQKCSTVVFKERYHAQKDRGATFEDVMPLIESSYGFRFGSDDGSPMALSTEDVESLKRHFVSGGLSDKARRIMQAKAGVGWTSGSHTGLPVLTTSAGPGSEHFTGFTDNTDISKTLKLFWLADPGSP